MLLLGANGFWISRLVTTLDKLREIVENLQNLTGRQETAFQGCKDQCDANNEVVTDRLNAHSDVLKKHGEDISGIKAVIKYKEAHESQ